MSSTAMTKALKPAACPSSRLRIIRSRIAPFSKNVLMHVGGYAVLRRVLPSRRVAILRYHAICGEEGYAYADPAICISPDAFEHHVRHLATNYAVLPLLEVVDRLRGGPPLPRNSVVITFDDGYADNLEAARTLNRYGVSGTFFITAGCLSGGEPFWPAEIRGLIPAVQQPMLRLRVGGDVIKIPLRDSRERRAAIGTVTRLIKSHSIPTRESLREQLRLAAGEPRVPSPMLSWEQVREMALLGMHIGAHTMTHPNLPNAGLAAATLEISGSKVRLERELGLPVTLFSYPNGGAECYFTPELQRLVAASGFTAAATSRKGFATPNSDPFALERVEVKERLEDLVFALEVERFAFVPRHS